MLENNFKSLELRIRIIEGEIRESKREKEKCRDAVFGIILSFVIFLVIGCYYFFIKKRVEEETLAVILSVILLLTCPVIGYYWYNKYKKASKKIEELEKELYLLKKGLKE